MCRLRGKVALVSGSGRGIGQAIAMKLAAEGAQVVVNDVDPEPARDTVQRINDVGGQAVAEVGDVTAPDFAPRFVARALSTWGRLDIIINNAGYTWDTVIQKTSDDQWIAMLGVHATAPFTILRAAIDYIRQAAKEEHSRGELVYRKVVNITSTGALHGNAGQAAYTAGKAAVIGLTKTLSREWARYLVNVNCVAFGLIHTRLTQPVGDGSATIEMNGRRLPVGISSEMMRNLPLWIPMARGGTPEEAAGAVFLLCLPEANYITGHVLVASGGY